MLLTGIVIGIVLHATLPLPPKFRNFSYSNLFYSIAESTIITFLTWESTLWFDHWVSKFLPWEKSFWRRFFLVMLGSCLLCVIFFVSVGYLFNYYICMFPMLEDKLLFKICFMVAITASILILMVEFGVQIFTKWKQSLVEIEQYKSQTMQAKLDNLKHQVNPHFLFNNMSVLTSLIYKDQDKAADFVQQLSKVYRYLLDQTSSELVCLEEEMKFLESYIYLLQIRYSPNLTIENKISANQLKRLIPPFSVQLLLENAIKHNEVSTEKPLLIELSIENEMLIVKNNKNPRISEEESSRKGLKNIQSRYAFFTDKPVEIVDLPRSFIVRIPLLQEE